MDLPDDAPTCYRQTLDRHDLSADDFAEIVRESETLLEVQKETRITNRNRARALVHLFNLEDELVDHRKLLRKLHAEAEA